MIKIIIKSGILLVCFSNFSMQNEIEEKKEEVNSSYQHLIQNFYEEVSKKINLMRCIFDYDCIMEASLDDIKKTLEEKFDYFTSLHIQIIKNNSFRNLKDAYYFDAWIDIICDNGYVDKNEYKKQLKHALLPQDMLLLLGSKFVEYENKYKPIATSLIYYNDTFISFLLPYEKIKDKNNEILFRKKIIFEGIKNAPEEVKKVIIFSKKEDISFFESIGMKQKRSITNSYA